MADPATFSSEVDFGLEIDFKPNTPDPARVFRAMTGLIEACQEIDQNLAASISVQVKPVLYLEDIQTGSLTTLLRSMLQSIDDEALKGLDWKKAVGAYLVKGKRVMVDYLSTRATIQSRDEIYDLQAVLAEAANETTQLIPGYSPPPARQVADSVKLLSDATIPLDRQDRARYISAGGIAEINTSFRVTTEAIEEVLTEETITNTRIMILKVKKPDFLGESMWDFRFEGKRISAKVLDARWLNDFHSGVVTLHPGDALRGAVEETVKYGFDREVIATHYKVVDVQQIIPRNATG